MTTAEILARRVIDLEAQLEQARTFAATVVAQNAAALKAFESGWTACDMARALRGETP